MTNSELVFEIENARQRIDVLERLFEAADRDGKRADDIEIELVEWEEDLKNLLAEADYRANWEPRRRDW